MRNLLFGIVVMVGLAASLSCSETCDPDQMVVQHVCRPRVADAATTTPDANSDESARADAQPPCDAGDNGFGQSCATVDDCRCGTDLCVTQFPGRMPFCTRKNCLQDPTICPAGWTCFDANAFNPGTSLCLPP